MKFGVVIMSALAALWWVVAVWASGHASVLMFGIPCIISGCLIVSALRQPDAVTSPEEHAHTGRVVGIASAAEGIAIFLAVTVLQNMGKNDFVVSAVAIIVGLHFIPLARYLPVRLYYATAALLVVIGIAGFWVAAADQRILAVSIGGVCILWLTLAIRLLSVKSSIALSS